MKKLMITLLALGLILVGCTQKLTKDRVYKEDWDGKPIIVKQRNDHGDYEVINEITDPTDVKELIDILKEADWEENVDVDIEPPDYTFTWNSYEHGVWIVTEFERLNLIIDGQSNYGRLSKEDSKIVFELLTGTPLVFSFVTMPEKMPDDFNFSVQFGVMRNNEINTFENTVSKDLITKGIAKAEITLTEEEMNDIYEKMKVININERKDFIPKPVNGNVCQQKPHEDDKWEIMINGETITHFISGKYCDPTKDAKQLLDLRNYIFNIVKNKDEYKALPEAEGGYQ